MMLGWLLGAAWLSALWTWLGQHPRLHADSLYLYDLLGRLDGGSRLGLWDLPPAPSFFPDLGLVWLSLRWDAALPQALRLFGLLMGFWAWGVLARLLRLLLGLERGPARAASAAGLTLLILLAPESGGWQDWLLPSHHGAAFLGALGLWAWVLRQRERPQGLSATLWGALPAGLLLGSDPFFGLWGFVGAALLALRLRWSGRARLMAGALLTVLLAWAFRGALKHTGARLGRIAPELSLEHLAAAYRASALQLRELLAAAPLFSGALAAGLLLWAWPRPERDSGPRVALLAWAVALGVTVAFTGPAGFLGGRYLYPLLLPVLLLPALIAERWGDWSMAALLGPAFAGLMLLRPGLPPVEPAELRQAAWLDQQLGARGLHWGWADYWHARPLRLLSRQGAVLMPMTDTPQGPQPHLWIGDRSLFAEGVAVERPEYLLVNGLDEEALRRRFGKPDELLQGEGLTLWFKRLPAKRKP